MIKYYFYFLLITLLLTGVNSSIFAAVATISMESSITPNKKNINLKSITVLTKTDVKMDIKKWLPLGLGILGLALIFVPYLSLIGLIAGVLAVVTGFLFRKKYPKTARWGIWLGGICIVAFLAVLGLILFF